MGKSKKDLHGKKQREEFNSVTQSVKPENQNQTHNSKKEGAKPVNQKK